MPLTPIPRVPLQTPMYDADGNITRTWVIFFEKRFRGDSTDSNTTGGVVADRYERYVFGIGVANDISVATTCTPKITVERPSRLQRWRITANVAPVGASIQIDILRNGISIFPAGGANKIVLAAAAVRNKGTVFATTPLNLLYEDELTCDVLQVGSTTPGYRIEVQLVGQVV